MRWSYLRFKALIRSSRSVRRYHHHPRCRPLCPDERTGSFLPSFRTTGPYRTDLPPLSTANRAVTVRCCCSGGDGEELTLKTAKAGRRGKGKNSGTVDMISELVVELVAAAVGSEPEAAAGRVKEILEAELQIFVASDRDFSVRLLNRLERWPELALRVFNWKRQRIDDGVSIAIEEYSKAMSIAGRLKQLDLAHELFTEACSRGIQTTSTYNGLMTAYMYNGLTKKVLSIFEDLKTHPHCSPNIVTYNILLSVFGRSMLVDHMEMVYGVILESNLTPNVSTYNTLIAGYITAWMWKDMEKIFEQMSAGNVKPDTDTYLLLLRGYAHWGRLDKMEEMYELVKDHVNKRELPLIRAMVCAYCKSSDFNRVRKIEELMKLLPQNEHRAWLDVLLIRVYAQEDLVEGMENSISRAFKQNTVVVTASVMRSIISSYFRCNAVDNLSSFVKQAESAGWKLCRSIYHCLMVMYGAQCRLAEMENVLDEMKTYNFSPTKKTFLILYKVYAKYGKRNEMERLLTIMCKAGFGIPLDALSFFS
ncbi:pentatricopeptide repeat-containing protein At2g30780 [Nymphaea colorata]|nr:pentatricopeptide repeat-containing protein At2g30780 [Nymphaea colorata]XP_031502309.1 pentatricopeptide repeat-containing protein At2g30780 [Nymphaea colorata]